MQDLPDSSTEKTQRREICTICAVCGLYFFSGFAGFLNAVTIIMPAPMQMKTSATLNAGQSIRPGMFTS